MKITHRTITASTDPYDVFMLMDYESGDSGMESDNFYCYGKFFARDIEDAKRQLEQCKEKYPFVDTDDLYVSEYNEYFDDFDPDSPNFDPYDYHTNEVFNNLDALFSTFKEGDLDYDDDLPFSSTDIGCSTTDIADIEPIMGSDPIGLESEITNKVIEVMTSPEFGFTEDEAKDYSFVEVFEDEDDGATIVEIRAEVSYDGLSTICDACDPIVRKYDEDAYFDMVQPGIAQAYIASSVIEGTSYGGAYDIEDDMFFTREEIDEWAYKVVDEFNIANNENYRVEDVYFTNSTDLTLDVGNEDTSFVATVKIDMRRIRKPSDINKYVKDAVDQLQIAYDDFHAYDIQSSTAITAEDGIDDDTDDTDGPIESKGDSYTDAIEFDLDTVIVVDGDGDIIYKDNSYEWLTADTNPNNGPVELDDFDGVAEKVLELIESSIPTDPGEYKVTGKVDLVYEVSGIETTITDRWDEGDHGHDYYEETSAEDAEIEYLYRESSVDNLKVEKI